MQLQNNKTQNLSNKLSIGACFVAAGALALAGGIGAAYHANASASDYSLTNDSVALDGTNNGSATISFKTSAAHTYTAIESTWSIHEVVEEGATQTSFLTLSGMQLGGTETDFGEANGKVAWIANSSSDNLAIAAGNSVLTATYTVDKDTPSGAYKISFTKDEIVYDVSGSDVTETEAFATDATITVTRADEEGDGDDETAGDDEEDIDTDDEEEEEDEDESDIAVPNTGKMTGDGNGANTAMISLAAIAAVSILFAALVQIKSHKKVSFNQKH